MKRCLALVFGLLVLLSGCGKEMAQQSQTEGETLPRNLQIRAISEPVGFGGFRAGAPGDGEAAARALVEPALAAYPAGLLAQLGPVEVLLVGGLTGEGNFAHGSYAGFTQRLSDGWRMVLDVNACTAGTVHHEMGHILDGILTEAGALTEEEWLRLCPPEFQYGSGDWEGYSDFFADAYAMTDMKEDRAAVFEAAMMGGEGVFDGKSPLWLKLSHFSAAIRDHFDTTGWPAAAIWELALH